VAIVIAQQAAESFAASEGSVIVSRRRRRGEQSALEALRVALEVIVLHKFSDGAPKVPLAD
jgi:hypothetical protein